MSELESLCHALMDSVRALPALASTLQQRASRLRVMAAQIVQAARQVENGPNVSHIVQSLYEAASAMVGSGDSLTAAVQQSRNFASRTIGGGSRGGGAGRVESAPAAVAWSGAGGGLTQDDQAALADYTGDGYKEMNPMLRRLAPLNVDLMRRCAAVSRALSKLPDYEGIVMRGRNLHTPEEIALYKTGSIVRERGFTSSDMSTPFAANTIFYIESSTGKNISDFSAHGHINGGAEREVLFNSGTEFQVKSNSVLEGIRIIIMKEV